MKPKITVIGHHFPTVKQPYLQPFIKDHIKALQITDFETEFIQVHPKMIPFTTRWKQYNSPLLTDISHKKLSYFSVPARKAPGFVANQLYSVLTKEITPASHPILHLHWLYPAGIAIPKLKKDGYKCILTIHGSDWFLYKNKPKLKKRYQEAIHNADLVFTSGPKLKEDIQSELNPEKEIICLYNYIDTNVFKPVTKSTKQELKIDLNFSNDKVHVLTVANIRQEKGIDVLLDAIPKTPSHIQFHIIGQQDNTPYVSHIKEQVTALNKHEIRVLLHEPIARNKLTSYYNAADFYVLPSRSEGFNVSLLEAMSSGLPVIASKTGGAELLINDQTGLLFDIEDADTLSHHITSISTNLTFYNPENLHNEVIENYSLNLFAKILDNYYQQVLEA